MGKVPGRSGKIDIPDGPKHDRGTASWVVTNSSAYKVARDSAFVDRSQFVPAKLTKDSPELAHIPEEERHAVAQIASEEVAPPGVRPDSSMTPVDKVYAPDPRADADGDGVTDFARVGVPALETPPPPLLPRLPGLNWNERMVEERACLKVEEDIDRCVSEYDALRSAKQAGNDDPKFFGTDDAKHIFEEWHGSDDEVRGFGMSEIEALGAKFPDGVVNASASKEMKALADRVVERVMQRRSEYNTALHQAANAVAKRAFLKELDRIAALPADKREILVTNGGCGAGKGFSLEVNKETKEPNVPVVHAALQRAAAVWDSAGDQNSTENPWIERECARRGIRANYVYIHADASDDPKTGSLARQIGRALKNGRMVDGRVSGESYEIGRTNFESFAKGDRPSGGSIMYVDASMGMPKLVDSMPTHKVYTARQITETVERLAAKGLPPEKRTNGWAKKVSGYVMRAATSGYRVFMHRRNAA